MKNDQKKRGNGKKHHPDRFRPEFFSHNARGGGSASGSKKETETRQVNTRDMATRKTISRHREPHTFSRPDFAKVHTCFGNSFWIVPYLRHRSAQKVPFVRPSLKTIRYTFSRPLPVVSNGLTKVLFELTGGVDKVRLKKNSQNRCVPWRNLA